MNTPSGLMSKWKTCLAEEYPKAKETKNKGNIAIILILVIVSRYIEVKLFAVGHKERL